MAEYSLKEIDEKKKTKGKESLTAVELAVESRNWNENVADKQEKPESVRLEDWSTESEEAKDESLGFFGKVGRAFASSIDLDFNGTQLKGDVGYQVKGGAVPLFSGVVLDLKPAEMIGERDGWGRQKVLPKNGGTAAKLIVTPNNQGFIKEHSVEFFFIAAPKKGKVDEFDAAINDEIEYNLNLEKKIEAKGAYIDGEHVELIDAKMVDKDGKEKRLSLAAITKEGVVYNESTEQEGESAEKAEGEETEEVENGKKIGTDDINVIYNLADKTALINFGTGTTSEEEQKKKNEKKDENEKSVLETLKHPIDAAKEKVDKFKEEVSEVFEKLGFAKEAVEQFFKDGTMPENKYDTDDSNDNSVFKELEASVDIFPGFSVGVSFEPSYSYGFNMKMGLLKRDNKDKENTEGLDAGNDKGEKVVVVLERKEKDSAKAAANGENANGAATDADSKKDVPVIKEIKYPEFNKDIKIAAMLKGSIGAALSVFLQAGLNYIFAAQGKISAEGKVAGCVEGAPDDVFAMADVTIPVESKDGSGFKMSTPELGLKGAVNITGNVGASAGLVSELFDWEKDLWSYTFKEWKLAQIDMLAKYKEIDVNGKLCDIKNWKKQESEFNVEAFGKKIVSNKYKEDGTLYGIYYDEKNVLGFATESGKSQIERMKKLSANFEVLKEKLKDKKLTVNTKAYASVLGELTTMTNALIMSMDSARLRIETINTDIEKFMDSKKYKKNEKTAKEGIEKHKRRLGLMKEWGENKENDKSSNNAAFTHYYSVSSTKGALNAWKENNQEKARKKVATKENIINYEKERKAEIVKKHTDRLKVLSERYDKMTDEEKKTFNPEFLKAYKDTGATELVDKAYEFADINEMKQYEREKIYEHSKVHRDRYEKLKSYCADLKLSEEQLKTPNAGVLKYYKEELKASGFFDKKLMENHGDVDDLINYEKVRMMKIVGDDTPTENGGTEADKKANEEKKAVIEAKLSRITKLKGLREQYKNAKEQKDKEEILEQARGIFGSETVGEKQLFNAATSQDIIDYEKNRYDIYRNEEKNKGKKEKSYNEWAKSLKDGDVKRIASIDMLIAYEEKRKAEYEQKKQKAVLRNYDKDIAKHQERIDKLNSVKLSYEAYKINNPDDTMGQAKILADGKDEYFDSAKEYISEVQKGENKNDELEQLSREESGLKDSDKHFKRIKSLCKYMGLKEPENPGELDKLNIDTSKSIKSDMDVHEYYIYVLGGGSGFNGAFKKASSGWSIDQMINFEEMTVDTDTRKGAVKRNLFRFGNWIKKKGKSMIGMSENGGKDKDITTLNEDAGHYRRYRKLVELNSEKKPAEEIFRVYRSIGGGDGYEKDLKTRLANVITPKELMDYEQDHKGKAAEPHVKLLDMLNSIPEGTDPKEVAKKYHEMAQTVGGGLSGMIVAKLHDYGADFKSDFEKEKNTEELLTPERIMEYEQIRVTEKGAKHDDRIKELDTDEMTDDNILEAYRKMGAGKSFFKKNSDAIKSEAEKFNNNVMSYDEIINYETGRMNNYEKLLKAAQEPVQNMLDVKVGLQEQLAVMNDYKKVVEEYLGKGNKVFENEDNLSKFSKETVGETAQNKVAKSDVVVEAEENVKADDIKDNIEKLEEGLENDGEGGGAEELIDIRQFLKEQNEAAPATEHEPESGESEKITWQEYLKEQSASGE